MVNNQTKIDSLLEKGVGLMRQGAFSDAEKILQKVLVKFYKFYNQVLLLVIQVQHFQILLV